MLPSDKRGKLRKFGVSKSNSGNNIIWPIGVLYLSVMEQWKLLDKLVTSTIRSTEGSDDCELMNKSYNYQNMPHKKYTVDGQSCCFLLHRSMLSWWIMLFSGTYFYEKKSEIPRQYAPKNSVIDRPPCKSMCYDYLTWSKIMFEHSNL